MSESDEKQSDMVLLKQEWKTKLTRNISTELYLVLDKTGNSVAVESLDGVR